MNKLIVILLFIVVACNQAEQKRENNIASADTTAIQPVAETTDTLAEFEKLNNVLKKYESKPQTFTVSSVKTTQVAGNKGTLITVDPSALETEDGKPLGNNIELELKELTNQADLLKANAQTVSDDRLLVSGGAYYIGMTSNGSKLRIKNGKTLKVQFPAISDKQMEMFYGQQDSSGNMNWKQARQKFVRKKTKSGTGIKRVPAASQKTFDVVVNGDTMRNVSREELNKLIYPKQNPITFLKANTLVVGEVLKMTETEKEEYVKSKTEYEKLYGELNISSLGWINCDLFLNAPNTELIVEFAPADSVRLAKVFLVFKDINSVLQPAYSQRDKKIYNEGFLNVPVGYNVQLICYTLKGGKIFADASDITIEKDMSITPKLRQMSDEEFGKLLSSN